MILKYPRYRAIEIFIIILIISNIAIILNKDVRISLSYILHEFFGFTKFVLPLVLLICFLLYWQTTKIVIDEYTKTVCITTYRLKLFKLNEYKFNGKDVLLKIVEMGFGDVPTWWRLYLSGSTGSSFVIMQSALRKRILNKAEQISNILSCRLEDPGNI